MILAINYANDKYKVSQKYNSKTALRNGADKVVEYSPSSIDGLFRKENEEIMSAIRGDGYWLWKPYIILDALDKVKQGDYVIYADSGSAYVNNIKKLIASLELSKQDIMIFSLSKKEKYYSKRDAFVLLDCDFPEYYESPQRIGTYILLKKNSNSVAFVEEWLKYSQDKRILTNDDNVMGLDNYSGFIENRHDQTVLSLLSKKHNLMPFRDPSQYGFEEGYSEVVGEDVIKRSSYPQIFDSHRLPTCSHFYQLTYRKWYRWFNPQVSPLFFLYRRVKAFRIK
ncbi:hypothetical protein SAMN04487831_11277 [Pseudobutyrivibrio sp. UC1225]|uniref:hypothetical protein n=1 Tax=Pseudobutyrivibrio sp. UC1225 TaxID=1798185 RepID=UPI0008ED844D|nr:hypothetical protein [Pseudobutyrivibrio sp. UC1225]SFO22136.1 hypothetical protein SAMN04487831_11277 [Pseudobutyrivibrio sp. UC1225]